MMFNDETNDTLPERGYVEGTIEDEKKVRFMYQGNPFCGDIEQVNGKFRVSGQEIVAYHADKDIAVRLFIEAVLGMADGTIELGGYH